MPGTNLGLHQVGCARCADLSPNEVWKLFVQFHTKEGPNCGVTKESGVLFQFTSFTLIFTSSSWFNFPLNLPRSWRSRWIFIIHTTFVLLSTPSFCKIESKNNFLSNRKMFLRTFSDSDKKIIFRQAIFLRGGVRHCFSLLLVIADALFCLIYHLARSA